MIRNSLKLWQRNNILFLLAIILLLSSCTPVPATPGQKTPQTPTHTAVFTSTPTPAPTTQKATAIPTAIIPTSAKPTSTPDLRLRPEIWQAWPIIPELSPEMVYIYQQGLKAGRDPHVFSVIGDCQSSPTYFLSLYDEGRYTLPEEEQHLEDTIRWYAGSFSHRSITVKNGLTAPGALNPRWADPDQCEKKETPIECEIRLNNPSLVLISLGTNWHPSSSHEEYLAYLTQIIAILLEYNIVPVLSTKADNVEGDYGRNLAMAQVAYDLHLPLWNFWATVQHLPNNGLDKTRNDEYLTRDGWDVRNLSALRVLDQIRRQLNETQETN